MTFTPQNFRPLPEGLPGKLRTQEGMTLILVQASGAARYGRTCEDKDALVGEYAEGDLLLLAWTGRYRTDVFLLSAQDLAKHYR